MLYVSCLYMSVCFGPDFYTILWSEGKLAFKVLSGFGQELVSYSFIFLGRLMQYPLTKPVHLIFKLLMFYVFKD